MIIILDLYLLSLLKLKSDDTIFIYLFIYFFCLAVQGRESLISKWNSHASQTSNIQLKTLCVGWGWG